MKILTLNAHSHIEEKYTEKLEYFADAVCTEKPEIIALQEVSQSTSAPPLGSTIRGYTPCVKNAVIRADNHVFRAAQLLREKGEKYYWTWLPLKKGYDVYDEGIALMSRSPILETDQLLVSKTDDYEDWKTRRLVGIRTERLPDEWFFSVHFGWWNDPDEPFRGQWIKAAEYLTKYDCVWLMGDFNSPAEIRGEGYDLVKRSYVHDAYVLASEKDGGITADGKIDGWKDKAGGADGMRIDQIWCSKKAVVTSSKVIFNGKNYPVVSDHFGVLVNYEKSII